MVVAVVVAFDFVGSNFVVDTLVGADVEDGVPICKMNLDFKYSAVQWKLHIPLHYCLEEPPNRMQGAVRD